MSCVLYMLYIFLIWVMHMMHVMHNTLTMLTGTCYPDEIQDFVKNKFLSQWVLFKNNQLLLYSIHSM